MRTLSVVVVCHNNARWLPICISGLLSSQNVDVEVQVVDNASEDGSSDLVASVFPNVRLVGSPRNLGFAGGANLGLSRASSEHVVVMNPDVVVRPDCLSWLFDAIEGDDLVAIAGGKLLYPDGRTLQHAGGVIVHPTALTGHRGHWQLDRGQFDRAQPVEFVTGALLAVRRPIIEALGAFDEGFFPAYYEDTDLCLRARKAGYRVMYEPRAVAVHYESVTTGRNTPRQREMFSRNRIRFALKHYSDGRVWDDLAAAEMRHLRQVTSYIELASLRKAYADNLAVLGDNNDRVDDSRYRVGLETSTKMREALQLLENEASRLLDLREGGKKPDGDHLGALYHQGQLIEPCFSSNTKIVGPLLVRIRRAWNWMSTKWFVAPILQQQREFNAMVAQELRETVLAVGEIGRALELRKPNLDPEEGGLDEVRMRLHRVEERISRIEDKLDRA